MSRAYYNEHDPRSAVWLRELIARELIAPGDVDERSVVDVSPTDLVDYTQCHFFAGIGVWSYALRSAGWRDDRPVWTGSCPCQPFSQSGKGEGFADDRHLWPVWFRLLRESRPDIVFGEQVSSKRGLEWLDVVSTDLESADYAIGALDTCAAGIGAPHIRQRLYFVADSGRNRVVEYAGELPRHEGEHEVGASIGDHASIAGGATRGLADDDCIGRLAYAGFGLRDQEHHSESRRELGDTECAGLEGHGRHGDNRDQPGRLGAFAPRSVATPSTVGDVGDADRRPGDVGLLEGSLGENGRRIPQRSRGEPDAPASPLSGFWRDADWLACRDGKARPVEPGTFPLAHGAPARVGRLRGYGNALCAPQAIGFIEAFLDVTGGR